MGVTRTAAQQAKCAQRNASQQRLYRERVAKGLCVRCGAPAYGQTRCDAHRGWFYTNRAGRPSRRPDASGPMFPPRTPEQTYERLLATPFAIERERAA